ncbi:hypothetical protein K505DRAFT_338094 [Melanomma pulvis-pyrius CBS 109.77]|uniref:Uncharacterized protein n=1 Tax=Melanomma pulvis-pyrius CBS 109.77 TaxID=1314802 RepID=A0A6A6XBM2_9PLEO|nr:hypothetical protein K505DRAFT_338094 [Melanomma pulvis-pyrius CBS 109.77]
MRSEFWSLGFSITDCPFYERSFTSTTGGPPPKEKTILNAYTERIDAELGILRLLRQAYIQYPLGRPTTANGTATTNRVLEILWDEGLADFGCQDRAPPPGLLRLWTGLRWMRPELTRQTMTHYPVDLVVGYPQPHGHRRGVRYPRPAVRRSHTNEIFGANIRVHISIPYPHRLSRGHMGLYFKYMTETEKEESRNKAPPENEAKQRLPRRRRE